MLLYPQLPRPVAQDLASKLEGMEIAAFQGVASLDHPDVYYTPTGGRRTDQKHLARLRDSIVAAAKGLGFPTGGTEEHRAEFDQNAAMLLHTTMNLSANEASRAGVWEFITCVLLCDVVRWRFPGGTEGTPSERFLSGRRNTFQRLWWRAFVLHDSMQQDPYHLLRALGEDEVVQIMERPFLAGSAPLARAVARQLLEAAERHGSVSRRQLIREGQKYIRRLAFFTAFDAVEPASLELVVKDVFDQVAEAAINTRSRARA